jgi:hypothetical protein
VISSARSARRDQLGAIMMTPCHLIADHVLQIMIGAKRVRRHHDRRAKEGGVIMIDARKRAASS